MQDDSDPTQKPTEDGTWGGLRDNSADMHKHRVLRDFKCDWCEKPFKAHHPQSRFCCTSHRVQAWKANQTPSPKRLTALDRKGKMFRPPKLLKKMLEH